MKTFLLSLAVIAAIALLGCDKGLDAQITATTSHELHAALRALKPKITKAQSGTLNLAISTALLEELGVERPDINIDDEIDDILSGDGLGEDIDIDTAIATEINGRSARDIINAAMNTIKLSIETLRTKQDVYREALDTFNKITISDKSFSWVKSGDKVRPLMEFKITNGLNTELYSVVTYLALLDDDKVVAEAIIDVPVHDENGGLRESDEFEAKYQPTDDAWVDDILKTSKELEVAVRVVNFRDMDQELVYEPFSKSDGDRLRQLQKHAEKLVSE